MEGNDFIQETLYSSNQSEEIQSEFHITNAPKMNRRRDNNFPTPLKLKRLDDKEFDSKNISLELDLNSLSPSNKGKLKLKIESVLDNDTGKRLTEDIFICGSRKNSQISTCNVTRDGDFSPESSAKEITILSYLAKKSGNL